jgi:hypothetical protein
VSSIPAARPAFSGLKLAACLNAGLAAAAAVLWLGMAVRGEFWKADFSAFYTGWAMVLDGHADRLYDYAEQAKYQAAINPERSGLLPFVYLPHSVVPTGLLALLPLSVAFYVWAGIQAALLALALRCLWDDARRWDHAAPALAVATLLAFQPVFLTFQLGQQSIVSLVALYGLARALRDDRPLPAAAWLVLASVKPQLALLPAVFLLGAGRWRVLLYASGLFAAWAAAATAVLGWRCWPDFLALTSFHARQFGTYGVYPLRGHNLKMVFAALLGRERLPLINALTLAGLLLAAVAALVLGIISRKADRPRWELCFAVTSFLAVLAAPHLNPHDALLLVVPAVLCCDALHLTGQPLRGLAVVLASCPLLFLADSYAMNWWPSDVRPFFFVIAGLTAWAIRDLMRHRTAAATLAPAAR